MGARLHHVVLHSRARSITGFDESSHGIRTRDCSPKRRAKYARYIIIFPATYIMYSAPNTHTLLKLQEKTPGILNRRDPDMWQRFNEVHQELGKIKFTGVKGLTLDELLEHLKAFSQTIATLGSYCWVAETLGSMTDHKSSEWVGWNTLMMSRNLPDAAIVVNDT
jgi:hypothetical protein